MQRRELVSILSATAAAAVAPLMARGETIPVAALLPRRYDDFAIWLEDARDAGLSYLREFGATDAERFMRLLSIWACAMPEPPEPAWQPVSGANTPLEMATIAAGRPFVVSAFRMARGCVLPVHCHPDGGGITMCRRGSLTIQHFELRDAQPSFTSTGASVEVQQVQTAHLAHNQSTLFTPSLANLHRFRAGDEGAQGVEFAVQWRGSGEFSFLKLHDALPPDGFHSGRYIKGSWAGMRLADAYP